jgi:uncharacterized protein (DUF433 family)
MMAVMGQRDEMHLESQVGVDSSCITQTAGVVGGEKHIVGTRIPVWSLEHARRRGIDDDRVLEMYPTIAREQLQAAHSYADLHADEMDRLIAQNAER